MKAIFLMFITIISFNTFGEECLIDSKTNQQITRRSEKNIFKAKEILKYVSCPFPNTKINLKLGELNHKNVFEKSVSKIDIFSHLQNSKKIAFSHDNHSNVFILNKNHDGQTEVLASFCVRAGIDEKNLKDIKITNISKTKKANECSYNEFSGLVEASILKTDGSLKNKNQELYKISESYIQGSKLTRKIRSLCYDESYRDNTGNPCFLRLFATGISRVQLEQQCQMIRESREK